MSAVEVRDLIHLYRDVSADLARLRAVQADPPLIQEINRLVTRAHAQIYRSVPREPNVLVRFFLRDYPRLFRSTWRFSFASFIIGLLFTGIGYRVVQDHPDVVADFIGAPVQEFRGERTAADIEERFRALPSPVLSSFVTWNNIRVALVAFALGITFGIGTVYVLMTNGMMLGGFAGAYAQSGVATQLWMTILPHGALELSAIVVAGGSGLMIGHALWCPGQRTRRRALREEAVRAAQLAVGLVPAFMIAGFIEGFITPSDEIPAKLKLALGLAAAAAFWLYLLGVGYPRRSAEARMKAA